MSTDFPAPPPPRHWHRRRRSRRAVAALFLAMLVIGAYLGVGYWRARRGMDASTACLRALDVAAADFGPRYRTCDRLWLDARPRWFDLVWGHGGGRVWR